MKPSGRIAVCGAVSVSNIQVGDEIPQSKGDIRNDYHDNQQSIKLFHFSGRIESKFHFSATKNGRVCCVAMGGSVDGRN